MEAAQAAMVAATEQRELDRIKVMENQLNVTLIPPPTTLSPCV